MAADKTNNLTAFLTDIATTIRTAEGTTANINPQDFSDRIEALPATVRPNVGRAETTLTVTADDTNDKLTIAAANNQGTGYVTGANKTASTTVSLTASGKTVTATATDGTKVSKDVGTVSRASTTIATTADDTADTLTVTASNNQGTGYVTGSNKTASKTITLSVAQPTIDTSGNVTAIATAVDNSSTPVSISKASTPLALGAKTSTDVSVSGAKVSVPAGYYPSSVEKSVTTATRAGTSISVTADDTADTLKIDASNNQSTGYVTGANKTATTTVTLTASGATVTATETGGKKVSKSVTTASRAGTTLSVTADDSADTLKIDAANNQGTGYVTGSNQTATTTVTLTASGATVTATETGGKKVSKSVSTVGRADTTLTSSKNTTNNTLDFTASNNQGTGYVAGANKTATKSVSLSTNGATVTASDGTNSISTTIASGSYSASGGGLTAGATTVEATSSGVTLGTATTTQPSGKYIKVTGSGVVNRAAITKSASAGYVSTGSATVSSATSATSTTATLYYPISSNVVDTSAGDAAASQILSGKKAYVDGSLVTGTMTNNGAVAPTALNAGGSYTIPAGYHDGSGKVTTNSLASQTTGTASAGEILSGETAWVGGSKITGTMTNRGAVSQTLSTATTSYTVPQGYHNGSGKVSITLEEKAVTPTTATQTVTPSSGKVMSKVTVSPVAPVSGSIGGSASSGKATAAISNVNNINTVSNLSGLTAGTDYFTVKATATGTAGGYTPKYTVTTPGYIGSTVTGTKQTVSVSSDATGQSIHIPKASLSVSAGASAHISTEPGTVSVAAKTQAVSGKTQIAATPTTNSSGISKYYVAVNATAASNSTSGNIGGIASVEVASAGYAPTTLTDSGGVDGTATVDIASKTSSTYYLPIATGSCSASGGGLTSGAGSVSASGTNVSLTEVSSPPSSGAYITVTGSGSVSRAAITKTQTAGYIEAATSTASAATSKSSNTATKYYAIQQEGSVLVYGVYQFIATPTAAPLSSSTSYSDGRPDGWFAWTGGTTGSPGTALDICCHEMRADVSPYGFAIYYESTVVYSNYTAGGLVDSVGWQPVDGVSTNSCRTIIVPTPITMQTTDDFYKWFSNNTERIGDWTGGGGSSSVEEWEDETKLGSVGSFTYIAGAPSEQGFGVYHSIPNDVIIRGQSGDQCITNVWDANFLAENIKSGVTLFGKTGTYTGSGSGGSANLFPYSPTLTYSSLGTTYGFTEIEDGYYESNNKGKKSSYALGKFSFTVYETTDVTFEVINYAESNWDYAIFSTLDKTLSSSTSADTTNVQRNFKGSSSANIQTLTYSSVSAGTHFITVKFIKDSSGDNNNDSVRLRLQQPPISSDLLAQIIAGDPDLVASNIKAGVDIYGIVGTYSGSGGGGGGESGGTKTLSAGTYSTRSSPYLSNYSNYPAQFTIKESINGSFSDPYNGMGGTIDTIELSGNNGTSDAPVYSFSFYNQGSSMGSGDGYSVASYGMTITIDSDTPVSSWFYDVFTDMTTQ